MALLEEGAPPLPLSDDLPADDEGWIWLPLTFERAGSAARSLLQLGRDIEVLGPPELRWIMTEEASALSTRYRSPSQ